VSTRKTVPAGALMRALLLLLAVAAAGGAAAVYAITSRGLGTRVPPSAIETRIALAMRALATPRALREAKNPIARSDAVIEAGLAHFADHCASCHGNDGSGQTEMGRSFYPPAPDMRAARTQELSDGELFSIIENGIRLTGMPAWGTGTPEGERDSWALVHVIRRLPSLSAAEIARMEALNPKSPQEFREDEETRRFLAGEDAAPAAPSPSTPHGGHR
jgi:mono/diheme cytochrome c family protein